MAQRLITASAAIVFALGAFHLVYTIGSCKACQREPAVEIHMTRASQALAPGDVALNARFLCGQEDGLLGTFVALANR